MPPVLREDGFYVRKHTRWLFFNIKGDDIYFVDVRPHTNLEMCDNRMFLSNQAKLRSTIQRFGITLNIQA
ncbi:hypothetical protein, partial [Comamonas sp. NoAH]|uniref:hypothetical protein n=1 Tax=Comamonas halotolerans TaxID=3041496 RepID=UPI0024E0B8BC